MSQPVPLGEQQQRELVWQIGRALTARSATGWREVRVRYQAAGRHVEADLLVTAPDGATHPYQPAPDVVNMLATLRSGMYQPGRGTWLVAELVVRPGAEPEVSFGYDQEPRWRRVPPPIGFRDELGTFPRADEHIPAWLRQRLAGGEGEGPQGAPGAGPAAGQFSGEPSTGSPGPADSAASHAGSPAAQFPGAPGAGSGQFPGAPGTGSHADSAASQPGSSAEWFPGAAGAGSQAGSAQFPGAGSPAGAGQFPGAPDAGSPATGMPPGTGSPTDPAAAQFPGSPTSGSPAGSTQFPGSPAPGSPGSGQFPGAAAGTPGGSPSGQFPGSDAGSPASAGQFPGGPGAGSPATTPGGLPAAPFSGAPAPGSPAAPPPGAPSFPGAPPTSPTGSPAAAFPGSFAAGSPPSAPPAPSSTSRANMRTPRIHDGFNQSGRPVVRRVPLSDEERERVLSYLDGAPVVLAARGYGADAFDPDGAANVPLNFRTDGNWVWPGAVAYYLRVHSVTPDPDLVEHIRAHQFVVPEVDEPSREMAIAAITGGDELLDD